MVLPPKYTFSFAAQTTLVRFTGSLDPLAEQLGEVKTIAEIFFAARVNSLDGIQRVRVSDDDTAGPQSDYFENHPTTNNLAVITPFQVTFRSFSPEVGQVIAGFAASPHGFIVKSISVQPAGAAATTETSARETAMPMLATLETVEPILGQPSHLPPGLRGPSAPPAGPPPAAQPPGPPGGQPTISPGRGGLQTVLNEQLLRVTLVVEVVKLLPKK